MEKLVPDTVLFGRHAGRLAVFGTWGHLQGVHIAFLVYKQPCKVFVHSEIGTFFYCQSAKKNFVALRDCRLLSPSGGVDCAFILIFLCLIPFPCSLKAVICRGLSCRCDARPITST